MDTSIDRDGEDDQAIRCGDDFLDDDKATKLEIVENKKMIFILCIL